MHRYPSHEEPKSVMKTIIGREFNGLQSSEVPKPARCYQPLSGCSYPRGIEGNATASLVMVPEVKKTSTIDGRQKLCQEKDDGEHEDITVDLSNCHSAKLETVLKEGQRRKVTAE